MKLLAAAAAAVAVIGNVDALRIRKHADVDSVAKAHGCDGSLKPKKTAEEYRNECRGFMEHLQDKRTAAEATDAVTVDKDEGETPEDVDYDLEANSPIEEKTVDDKDYMKDHKPAHQIGELFGVGSCYIEGIWPRRTKFV